MKISVDKLCQSLLQKVNPIVFGNSPEAERCVRSLITMLQVVFAPYSASEFWGALQSVPLVQHSNWSSMYISDQPWPQVDSDCDIDFILNYFKFTIIIIIIITIRTMLYKINTLTKALFQCLLVFSLSTRTSLSSQEAIIYLENSKKDFESLIKTIAVELSWNESEKPQAVAWEIRKSMQAPCYVLYEDHAPSLFDVLPIPSMLMTEIAANSEREDKENKMVKSMFSSEYMYSVYNYLQHYKKYNLSRRSAHDISTASSFHSNSSGIHRGSMMSSLSQPSQKHSRSEFVPYRLTSPRSVMGLPQTKASMAKMAYSRQLLWEKDKSSLAEKLRLQQRRDRVRRSTYCSFNFNKRWYNDVPVLNQRDNVVDKSLQYIREFVGAEDEGETVPTDPKPTSMEVSCSFTTKCCFLKNFFLRSEPTFNVTLSSLLAFDLNGDVEWCEMTEKEQSLAFEEHSLNLEIKQEESDFIDNELERQVAVEAEQLEHMEKYATQKIILQEELGKHTEEPITWQKIAKKWESKLRFTKIKFYMQNTWRNFILDEMKVFASMYWSEIVDKELTGHFREPGTLAEKHEKMSSHHGRRYILLTHFSFLLKIIIYTKCDRNDSELSRRQTEKLRRANVVRIKLQEKKTTRLKDLARRVEEVRAKRLEVIERKRVLLHSKMGKAQENREKNIAEIIRRAKNDEKRVMEVQFINNLQSGNMRLDLRLRDANVEERKQIIAEERARRIEEKAAKEHAAEERRKQAEQVHLFLVSHYIYIHIYIGVQDRLARLLEIVGKKEARQAQIVAQKNEQEKLRSERFRIHREKLKGIKLADAEESEMLRQRIQDKITSSSRRHEKSLEIVRVRAQELASLRLFTYSRWIELVEPALWPSDCATDTGQQCLVCNIQLRSMAHVFSALHLQKIGLRAVDITCDVLVRK
uniref:SCAPER_N domain-containing protein n=1 Tax=Heterorhabditis bacteriophora TaxID=37862 RepID=A0A1I7WXX9_HETBA